MALRRKLTVFIAFAQADMREVPIVRKSCIAIIGSMACVLFPNSSASEELLTELKNPKTGDSLTLRTDEKGTFAKHSYGPSGYIIRPRYEGVEAAARADVHETYVRSYESSGYVRRINN